MNTGYVYLLSCYEEHGSEQVKATLDRRALPDLLRSYGFTCDKFLDQQADGLASLLLKPDVELASHDASNGTADWLTHRGTSGHNLTGAWGGFQLHVVPLSWAE